jgi:anthranilate/para-aminobenzoate synthase component II
LPAALHVCATSDDGVVQALDDSSGRIFGLQFHPESFLSERGELLLVNFLNVAQAC